MPLPGTPNARAVAGVERAGCWWQLVDKAHRLGSSLQSRPPPVLPEPVVCSGSPI
jgi:hypothetical protein